MGRRPLRALAATAATLTALTALAGCGDDGADEPEDTESSSESPSAGDPEMPESPESSVTPVLPSNVDLELLDAGSGDQHLMVLDVEEGATETTTMDTTMGMSIAGSANIDIPMTVTFESTVDDVNDDEITWTATYTDFSSDFTDAGPGFDEALGGLEGMTVTTRMTRGAATIEASVDTPSDADPSVQQMAEQMTDQLANVMAPFPTEPVGEGAQWRVVSTIETAAATMEQTATYTLVSFDGTTYEISSEAEARFVPAEDGEVQVVDGSQTSSGTISGTLAGLSPDEGAVHSEGSLTVEVGGRSASTTTDVDIEITTQR